MPLTPQSEPRRKSSPRWFLAFWLIVIAIRLWQVNHGLALALGAIALVILLSGLRRTERAGTAGPGSPTARPRFETVTLPTTSPDARPIEPDMGGATGKLIVLAIVLLVLGLLAGFLFRSQGWKLTP